MRNKDEGAGAFNNDVRRLGIMASDIMAFGMITFGIMTFSTFTMTIKMTLSIIVTQQNDI